MYRLLNVHLSHVEEPQKIFQIWLNFDNDSVILCTRNVPEKYADGHGQDASGIGHGPGKRNRASGTISEVKFASGGSGIGVLGRPT